MNTNFLGSFIDLPAIINTLKINYKILFSLIYKIYNDKKLNNFH